MDGVHANFNGVSNFDTVINDCRRLLVILLI
jgi:hypothetical protein